MLDFGLYDDHEANYGLNLWWYVWELPIFMAMGAVGGVLGALVGLAQMRFGAGAAALGGVRQGAAAALGKGRMLEVGRRRATVR